jgi:hypothetical protein
MAERWLADSTYFRFSAGSGACGARCDFWRAGGPLGSGGGTRGRQDFKQLGSGGVALRQLKGGLLGSCGAAPGELVGRRPESGGGAPG